MNLSSRHLRAFVVLSELRNFTKASEKCHLSQPAFSALIQQLESGVNARLFHRDTRNVQLTPEGQLFAESAERLLRDMDNVLENISDHVERRKGRVALAALPSLCAGWLPGVLGEFRARYPGIDISLTDTLSDQCIDIVRSGKGDLALASSPPHQGDLSTQLLCSDGFHLVCHKDHPLALQKSISPKDLVRHPFIHMSRSSSVRQHLEALLHPLQMNTVLEVAQLATVMGMVEGNVGISVVPALTLFHFERPNIVTRPLIAPGLKREIYIITRAGESLSVAAQALMDLVIQRRPQEPRAPRRRTSRQR
ncbi:LysR family transcriptional regulator [Hydrogenophaga sp.]|uniref:LysR family transcriptional regulator n=1 Tax=Hydrogenophaga sp. TaxID=1904254 RepID=UPI002717A308|nr:LysR family transcriptional regulator [Hydrogenophaga sp.]MDO9437612.1 LysR substrate-binding domain-containing protein [Hydrogenophaga sp.]